MPNTSVIITTHSRPGLLPNAVANARAAGADVEIVVVDDASSDETAEVCRRLEGIKYIRIDRNQRVAGARNVGLTASCGKYVVFLDDDDTRAPNSIDTQINALERDSEAGLVYGQANRDSAARNPGNEVYPRDCPQGDLFWKLVQRNFIPCGSVVFRRACLSRVGLLDADIPGMDDWDLWVRIAEMYRIIAVETPVLTWRQSTPVSGQGTSEAARLVSVAVRQFHSRWMKLPRALEASAGMRRATWRNFSENMAEHLIWESLRAMRYARPNQALGNLFVIPQLSSWALVSIGKNRVLRSTNRTSPGD